MHIKALIPKYAVLPLALAFAVNCAAYFGARLFLGNTSYHHMTLPVDFIIPFVPAFIVVYLLAYVQWAVGYIMICHDSRQVCYYVMGAEIAAKCICFLCFVFYPTTMVRADITGSSLFETAVRYLYEIDAPNNLFPSIHCLESYFCMRGAFISRKLSGGYRMIMILAAILVFIFCRPCSAEYLGSLRAKCRFFSGSFYRKYPSGFPSMAAICCTLYDRIYPVRRSGCTQYQPSPRLSSQSSPRYFIFSSRHLFFGYYTFRQRRSAGMCLLYDQRRHSGSCHYCVASD